MKRKILALLLGTVSVVSLAACDSSDANAEDGTKSTSGEITLGDYLGYEVSESDAEVTDSSLNDYIEYILGQNSVTTKEVTGTVEEDDVINITYTCTIDGEEVADLSSASETAVTVSDEGAAIEGFTDQLIGKEVGSTFEFDLTIQEDYDSEDYAGKDAHFKVTIASKSVTTVPEFTDEFVSEVYDYMGFTTMDQLKEYLTHELYINNIYSAIWDDVLAAQTVVSYDQADLDERVEQYKSSYENQIYYSTGADLATYLEAASISEADFMAQIEETAKNSLKEEMFLKKVIEAENISITSEEYDQNMLEYAKSYQFDTVEEFSSAYATITKDDFEFSMLSYLAQEKICESVKVVPDDETTAATEDTTAETEDTTAAE